MKQRKAVLIPCVAFLAITMLLSGMYLLTIHRSVVHVKEEYKSIASNQSNIICGRIDAVLARTHILSALVTAESGKTNAFDLVAAEIYESTVRYRCDTEKYCRGA